MSDTARRAVEIAVHEVLWNMSNYPEGAQVKMLGQDVTPLRDKVVDAVMPIIEGRKAELMTAAKRERIKNAIQTCQDDEGRLMYVIPPGAAGRYADAIMRALTPTHFECNCIPELGPSHCHGCTEEGDGPIVEWSKSRHTEADRQLEQAQQSLDALHSDGVIQTGAYSFLHDRIGLALAAIETERT